MQESQRLSLPFILPGQSQKEMFHNEALQVIDTIVAAAVEEGPRNDPPAAPAPGNCYIIGAAPTGAWSGRAGSLASHSIAGWRFIRPVEGMQAWVKSLELCAIYQKGAWEVGSLRGSSVVIGGQQVVGARSSPILDPSGGSTVDSSAREAIIAVLAALREHGLIGS